MSEAPVAEAQVNGENADAQPEENAVEEDQPKLDDQGQVKDAAAEEQPTTGEKADDAAAEVEPQPEVPKQEGMYEKLEAGPTSKGWKYRGPAAERAARKEYAGVIAVPSEGMYEKPEAGTSSQPWTYRGPAAERRAWRKSNNLPSESEDEEELEPLEPRLLAAFEANDAGVIAELVEESSNGVAALVNDQKLLHKACLLGFSDIVKIFLTLEKLSGEDVDEKSRTCLHCALDAPFEQRKSVAVPVIDALHSRLNSENLASVVNSPDSLGRTCVDMAASHSGEGMLLEKILFLKGNPNAVNKKSKPPLALAAMAGLPAHIKVHASNTLSLLHALCSFYFVLVLGTVCGQGRRQRRVPGRSERHQFCSSLCSHGGSQQGAFAGQHAKHGCGRFFLQSSYCVRLSKLCSTPMLTSTL